MLKCYVTRTYNVNIVRRKNIHIFWRTIDIHQLFCQLVYRFHIVVECFDAPNTEYDLKNRLVELIGCITSGCLVGGADLAIKMGGANHMRDVKGAIKHSTHTWLYRSTCMFAEHECYACLCVCFAPRVCKAQSFFCEFADHKQ